MDANKMKLVSKKLQQHSEDLGELKARIIHLETENEYLLSRNEALESEVFQFIRVTCNHDHSFKDSLTCANQNALLLKRIDQLEKCIGDIEIKMETDSSENKMKLAASELELSRSQNQAVVLQSESHSSFRQLLGATKETNDSNSKTASDNLETQLDVLRTSLSNNQQAMLAAKKETASLRQVYDIKTQNLRMKYEEQLLKVTQPNAHKA